MKLLHVLSSFDPKAGGVAQAVRIAVDSLEKINIENEIVCFNDPSSDFINNDTCPIYGFKPIEHFYNYSPVYKNWFLKNFIKYDAIIIHGIWQYSSLGTYKLWKENVRKTNSNCQLWVMPHGMLDPYFQLAQDRKIKAIRNNIFWNLFENRIINNSTGLLFTCKQELLLAKTTFPNYHPNEEKNIGLGINKPPIYDTIFSEAFYSKCDIKKDEKFILFLSRIDPKKGIDLLVKAYQKLSKIVPLPHLVVAGPGLDTDYGKEILKLASTNQKIHFPGMLTGPEKWGAFYDCEAFVLISHQENFGIAVAEALACSKPVLISNQINIYEEIENGKGGIVVTDSMEGAEKALIKFISLSQSDIKTMGWNAHTIFEKKFTTKKFANNLKDVIIENYSYGE